MAELSDVSGRDVAALPVILYATGVAGPAGAGVDAAVVVVVSAEPARDAALIDLRSEIRDRCSSLSRSNSSKRSISSREGSSPAREGARDDAATNRCDFAVA